MEWEIKKEETDENSYACTSAGITAWAHWLRPDGKYGLYLKVNLRGYIEGGVQCCPWCYCPLYPYTLKVNTPIDGAQAQNDPAPTGVNLRQKNESQTEVGEFVYDVVVTLLGYTPYVGPPITAADLAAKFYGLLKTPAPEPTYEFPHSWRWENMSALGEVYMEISLDPGTHLVQITLSVDYCYYNIWAQDVVYKTHDITLHFPWSSEHDELPMELSISTSSGGTTDPAPGTYTYDYGESVTVTASAYADYVFDYWLLDGETVYNNPITIQMLTDHTLEAHFAETAELTIKVPQAPPEGVTIWIDGNSHTAYAYTPVTVTLEVGQHTIQAQYSFLKEAWTPGTYYIYTFYSWSDGSTANPRTITLTSDKTLTANYQRGEWGILSEQPTEVTNS